MPTPCPPTSLLLPDDGRVILVSSPEEGLIISNGNPQTITSVSSQAWQVWDPQRSWTAGSAVNHSRYLQVGKFFLFEICYVFNAAPSFTSTPFTFGFGGIGVSPDENFWQDRNIFSNVDNLNISEPSYWSALDASTGQVTEGQICLTNTIEVSLRTGDDLGASNTFLGSGSLAWAVNDKIMATGIAEVL